MAEDRTSGKVVRQYRFATIPEWVLYHPSLSPLAVRIYGVLDRRGQTPQDCFPGHADIAKRAGCSARSVPRPLAELEAVGAIRSVHRGKKQGGGRTSDAYWLAGDGPLPSVEALLAMDAHEVTAQESVETPRATTRRSAERSTRPRVQNESQSNESQNLSLPIRQRVKVALDILAERDAKTVPNQHDARAVFVTCRKNRITDSQDDLRLLARKYPDWSAEALANAIALDDEVKREIPEDPDCDVCRNTRWTDPDDGPVDHCPACWPIITENRKSA